MKLLARYLKPFVGILLVCLVLLFGQAACDLSLPTLMSDMVNVGIQQSGLEAGAPEAMRQEGLQLLSAFAGEEDRSLLEGGYYTIEPGSSEAQRFAEDYPLVREEAVCVLREGQTQEELDALEGAYDRASYAMLLYFQQAAESGDLEQAAQNLAQSQLPTVEAPLPDGQTGLEGSQESFLQGALPEESSQAESDAGAPTLYSSQGDSAGEVDSTAAQEPVENSAPAGETSQEGGSGLDMSQGLESVSLEQLYQVIPLLACVPQEGLQQAQEQAAASDSMMGEQVGVTLARLFYEELGMDTAAIQSRYIWNKGLQMLGVALLGVIATVLVGFFSARMAAAVGRQLRHDLFAKVEEFSNGEFDRFSTASLITRTTNDVQQIQMLVTMGVRMICYTPIIGIGGVIFAVQKSVSLSFLVALAVVVFLGLILVSLAVVLPKFKILQKLIDKLNLVSRENLSGMMVVRAFGNEGYEERRFDAANRDLMETNRFVQRVMSLLMPAMMFGMNLLSVLIVWVGGHAIAQSTLQIGDMMAFIQYAMQIIMAFLMLAMIFILVPRASVSAGRILEVLDAPLSIQDPEKPEVLEEPKGVVEFQDVSFRYHNADGDVLEHISFTAKPGETTAFIGATGAGKSTLVNLIPRFYDVTEGAVKVGGHDVRDYDLTALRDAVGIVLQKNVLFSGTVRENLQWGDLTAGDEELWAACRAACADEFLERMPGGLDADLGQGGVNVSGGQKQRLCIARALLKRPKILIFDDSTSAVDTATEGKIRAALAKLTGVTKIIIAQRVTSVMHTDLIVILEDGHIHAAGTHEQLLAGDPIYQEIYASQMKGGEDHGGPSAQR